MTWPGTGGGGTSPVVPTMPHWPTSPERLEALICEKCSAAERISLLAAATSSLRPVTTKTGSSPRTGVLM